MLLSDTDFEFVDLLTFFSAHAVWTLIMFYRKYLIAEYATRIYAKINAREKYNIFVQVVHNCCV